MELITFSNCNRGPATLFETFGETLFCLSCRTADLGDTPIHSRNSGPATLLETPRETLLACLWVITARGLQTNPPIRVCRQGGQEFVGFLEQGFWPENEDGSHHDHTPLPQHLAPR